jgi:hypothetical protein
MNPKNRWIKMANQIPWKRFEEKDDDDDFKPGSDSFFDNEKGVKEITNSGTLILDATCAPSNIRYPQDYSLLNEGRKKLEKIIDHFCSDYSLSTPRMYSKEARKNCLSLAKAKRPSKNKIRKIIRKQLGYVKCNLGYLSNFMVKGYAPTEKEIKLIEAITTLYE